MTDIDLFSQMLLSAKVNFFFVVLGNVLCVSFCPWYGLSQGTSCASTSDGQPQGYQTCSCVSHTLNIIRLKDRDETQKDPTGTESDFLPREEKIENKRGEKMISCQ